MASHKVLMEQLVEMGFEEKLIQGALALLKDNATLESVIESIENGTASQQSEAPSTATAQPPLEPNKEPTAEEKEAKKKAMEERIRQRRLEIERKEKEDAIIREKKRIEQGKEIGKMKSDLEDIQRRRIAEEIRKEKEDDKAAKEKIRRAIEQDRLERKAKFANETVSAAAPTVSKPLTVTASSGISKDGKARLAIRMLDGSQVMQEFDAKELLAAVRAFVVSSKDINFNITFAMSPLPPFTESDMTKSLHQLGLAPAARLNVVKR